MPAALLASLTYAATRLGGELYGDALGTRGTPAGTYSGMVCHNARLSSAALLGKG